MKKLLLTVLSFLLLISPCFGAGGYFKVTGDDLVRNRYSDIGSHRVLKMLAIADNSTASHASLTINPTGWIDSEGNSGSFVYPTLGWRAYILYTDGNHAASEPTENTDITIKQYGVDLLDGNGTNSIDNTAERAVYFQVDGLPMPCPITDSLFLEISNNAVNSASTTFRLLLLPSE
uniref:Uncharacterized protein n=1 Tax=viral metagenome TaxID=1070528 RepID=A0A6H1ZP32_9ZZZZ